MPPMIPATIPANNGAPEACAIPRQSGSAMRKTISPARASFPREGLKTAIKRKESTGCSEEHCPAAMDDKSTLTTKTAIKRRRQLRAVGRGCLCRARGSLRESSSRFEEMHFCHRLVEASIRYIASDRLPETAQSLLHPTSRGHPLPLIHPSRSRPVPSRP